MTLLPGVENRQLGRRLGDDGLQKIVRTFAFRVRSVKCGGRGTARDRIAYVRREDEHGPPDAAKTARLEERAEAARRAGDAAEITRRERLVAANEERAAKARELEYTCGDAEALIAGADRIEATARIKRGPTAERILVSEVLELPAESTPEERAAGAEAIVGHWHERGHTAIAAVHVHGAENPQPHLHIEISARPVLADGIVDRTVRLWTDPSPSEAVKREREAMAEIVNETWHPDPPFDAGSFKDLGREDDTKVRLPISKYRSTRAEMAEDPDRAEEIERGYYAVEAERRDALKAEGEARRAEIDGLKASGEWRNGKPLSARAQMIHDARDAHRERDEAVAALRTKTADFDDLVTVVKADTVERDGREAALRDRADRAEGRMRELEALQIEPMKLTEAQKPLFAGDAGRNDIKGDWENDPAVQLRVLAAYHRERDERRRREKAEAAKAARPWQDLSDDQLLDHWSGASRQSRLAKTPDETAAAQRKLSELHEEAAHRGKTLKGMRARQEQREGRSLSALIQRRRGTFLVLSKP